MTDEYVPHFAVGEIAVLKTQLGGRLFTVGEVPGKTTPGEYYHVREVAPRHGVGKGLEVSTHWLIKVKDRDTAVTLVGLLTYIQERYRRAVHEHEQERNRLWRDVIADLSMEYQEEPE